MAEFNVSDPFLPPLGYPLAEAPLKPEIEPAPVPAPKPVPASTLLALPPLAIYPSKAALFEAIQSWAKAHGYAFMVRRSTQRKQRQKIVYACDRCQPTPPPNTTCIRDT